MSTKWVLGSYEVISHGYDYPDYFQGLGVCGTSYEYVATGIGSTEKEALEDCLEQIATSCDGTILDLERIKDETETSDVDEHAEPLKSDGECDDYTDLPLYYLSVRYSLEQFPETDENWQRFYYFWGDVDITCGGTFFDPSTFRDGYVSVVEVVDLSSACGREGISLLVEHKVVLTERWRKQGYGENVSYWDNWRSALSCCGPEPRELLSYDRIGKRLALTYALMGYGRYDPDESWDSYRSHWCTLVAIGSKEETPDESEMWSGKVEERFYSKEEFLRWLLSEHVGMEFVSEKAATE